MACQPKTTGSNPGPKAASVGENGSDQQEPAELILRKKARSTTGVKTRVNNGKLAEKGKFEKCQYELFKNVTSENLVRGTVFAFTTFDGQPSREQINFYFPAINQPLAEGATYHHQGKVKFTDLVVTLDSRYENGHLYVTSDVRSQNGKDSVLNSKAVIAIDPTLKDITGASVKAAGTLNGTKIEMQYSCRF